MSKLKDESSNKKVYPFQRPALNFVKMECIWCGQMVPTKL
jgi:hypothetical protein